MAKQSNWIISSVENIDKTTAFICVQSEYDGVKYNQLCNNSSLWFLQIDDIKQAFRMKQMEEEDHKKRISNTRQIIEVLKAELAKVGDQPDVTPRINEINGELRRIQLERAKIEGEKSDLCRGRGNICAESKSEIL